MLLWRWDYNLLAVSCSELTYCRIVLVLCENVYCMYMVVTETIFLNIICNTTYTPSLVDINKFEVLANTCVYKWLN